MTRVLSLKFTQIKHNGKLTSSTSSQLNHFALFGTYVLYLNGLSSTIQSQKRLKRSNRKEGAKRKLFHTRIMQQKIQHIHLEKPRPLNFVRNGSNFTFLKRFRPYSEKNPHSPAAVFAIDQKTSLAAASRK